MPTVLRKDGFRTLENKYDTLEQLIFSEGVRIQAIDFHKDIDLMLVILNTGSVLQEKLSKYKVLSAANQNALLNYKLVGNGTGVTWPELDEDLSLKGFLRDVLKSRISGNKVAKHDSTFLSSISTSTSATSLGGLI